MSVHNIIGCEAGGNFSPAHGSIYSIRSRRTAWRPFMFGALSALALVVALVCWAVR